LLKYVETCGIRWDAARHGQDGDAALVVLRLPGRVGVVLISPAPAPPPRSSLVELAVDAARRATAAELNYLQALVEPEDAGRIGVVEAAEFRHLTQLIYLERSATYPWVEPPGALANWAPFAPATESRFHRTLLDTYDGTLDCPELSGRRTTGEILAAHRASGAFDPALWELAMIDGCDAGCVLMHRVFGSDSLEVAYMGVAPAFRRRGVGGVLLRRALEKTRASGCARLRVVVDARNTPARALYERYEFRAIARREAYLRFVGRA
jgi:GNAT superfamily N-acetyltransferase